MSGHANTIRALEAERDDYRFWNERVRVCAQHTQDVAAPVGDCLICNLDALVARCDALENALRETARKFTLAEEDLRISAARCDTLENALRPFGEKWDLHALDYLADLIDGKEVRIIEASIVDEMIRDIEVTRVALAPAERQE